MFVNKMKLLDLGKDHSRLPWCRKANRSGHDLLVVLDWSVWTKIIFWSDISWCPSWEENIAYHSYISIIQERNFLLCHLHYDLCRRTVGARLRPDRPLLAYVAPIKLVRYINHKLLDKHIVYVLFPVIFPLCSLVDPVNWSKSWL